jgi:group I intron endonuclease
MNKSGIYIIKNTINGKVYVGYTTNINKRKQYHFGDLKNNKHINKHLQNAYNKYGKDAFVYSVLEICEKNKLIKQENYWANLLNAHNIKYGYNILPTSDFGKLTMAKESIIKRTKTFTDNYISGSRKGKLKNIPRSKETKDKIRNATLGKKKTLTNKQRQCAAERARIQGFKTKGLKRSQEQIEIMRQLSLKQFDTVVYNPPIIQYSKDFSKVVEHVSIRQAVCDTSISRRTIIRALSGERQTGGGYIWKYKI